MVTAISFHYLNSQTKIAHTIGRFGKLADDVARRFKSLMCIPYRTGRAITAELQFHSTMTLGYISGTVDASKENRHTLQTWPLQS